MNKMQLRILGAGVVVASASFALGYLTATKVQAEKFQREMEEEIGTFKATYRRLSQIPPINIKEDPHPPIIEEDDEDEEETEDFLRLASKYINVAEAPKPERKVYDIRPDRTDAPLREETEEDEAVDGTKVPDNIYIQPHDGGLFKYDEEERSEDEPYVISEDEYINREKGYETVCLTYFHKDDTVIDENELVVDNADMLIGKKNLTRFGHGSSNEDVVFIRNDGFGLEFEVEKVNLSYKAFILGEEDDE